MTTNVVIIGGGFTGCTYAYFCRQKGWDVTIVEKSALLGGGVRTYFHGGHPYTYGPRHFIAPETSRPAFDFLNAVIPMRMIDKINYSYQEPDDLLILNHLVAQTKSMKSSSYSSL